MLIKKVHHVAYRCVEAKQTVEWYEKYLGMQFILAIAEDEVPSTKEPDPIYFFDPNGHRLELAANTASPEMMDKLDQVKYAMLEQWSKTKRAPKHAAWMHAGN